jgi:hypothetical protein
MAATKKTPAKKAKDLDPKNRAKVKGGTTRRDGVYTRP